jgi:hypothetical protein
LECFGIKLELPSILLFKEGVHIQTGYKEVPIDEELCKNYDSGLINGDSWRDVDKIVNNPFEAFEDASSGFGKKAYEYK